MTDLPRSSTRQTQTSFFVTNSTETGSPATVGVEGVPGPTVVPAWLTLLTPEPPSGPTAKPITRPTTAATPTTASTPDRLRRSGVQLPLVGDSLELLSPAFREADVGAGDEVLHRPCDENLARVGERPDAGRDVDGDSADVSVHQLDLAGVEPDPLLQP